MISLRDFSFADYRVPFSRPAVDNYTILIHGRWPNLFLSINDEARRPAGIARMEHDRELQLQEGWYIAPADPEGDAAVAATERAVQGQRGAARNTTREVNVNIAARSGGRVYLRAGSTSAPASLPVELDPVQRSITLPLGADFRSAGFVVAAN